MGESNLQVTLEFSREKDCYVMFPVDNILFVIGHKYFIL